MATILDPAAIACATDDDDRPVVAFVSHPLTDDRTQNWWPYCGPCVERFTDHDFRVVYLHGHDDVAATPDRDHRDGPADHLGG